MSNTKRVDQLTVAYHGPTIPPIHQQPSQTPPKERCPVLATLLRVIIRFGIGFSIPLLIFYLAARPADVNFYVVSTNLTKFHLKNDNNDGNTLTYNLSLSIAASNPNKNIGIFYDKLYAISSYKGERFSWLRLPSFYQGHKNTTILHLNFRGQSVIVLDGSDVSKLNRDKISGIYHIDVKLYGKMRLKIGSIKTRRVKSEIECHLRIPLASNGTLVRLFESTSCDVYF